MIWVWTWYGRERGGEREERQEDTGHQGRGEERRGEAEGKNDWRMGMGHVRSGQVKVTWSSPQHLYSSFYRFQSVSPPT